MLWSQTILGASGSKGTIGPNNLILAGDLNFSTGVDEIWGEKALIDPHATFFRDLFTNHHLVDVKPSEVVPTWRNGRLGVEGIQKILDRVYASAALLNESAFFRSWVELPFISDHVPVIFSWTMASSLFLFLLNLIWCC
jgi:endonuclease/exonuclease/phosphatase family metal-dependent hydrolase